MSPSPRRARGADDLFVRAQPRQGDHELAQPFQRERSARIRGARAAASADAVHDPREQGECDPPTAPRQHRRRHGIPLRLRHRDDVVEAGGTRGRPARAASARRRATAAARASRRRRAPPARPAHAEVGPSDRAVEPVGHLVLGRDGGAAHMARPRLRQPPGGASGERPRRAERGAVHGRGPGSDVLTSSCGVSGSRSRRSGSGRRRCSQRTSGQPAASVPRRRCAASTARATVGTPAASASAARSRSRSPSGRRAPSPHWRPPGARGRGTSAARRAAPVARVDALLRAAGAASSTPSPVAAETAMTGRRPEAVARRAAAGGRPRRAAAPRREQVGLVQDDHHRPRRATAAGAGSARARPASAYFCGSTTHRTRSTSSTTRSTSTRWLARPSRSRAGRGGRARRTRRRR